jgi:hypothetical protein
LNKKNADALQAELDVHFLYRKQEIDWISEKFSKTPDYIQQLFNAGTNYRKSRAPSLQNALIHHKCEEVNGGMLALLFWLHDISMSPFLDGGYPHSPRDTGVGRWG